MQIIDIRQKLDGDRIMGGQLQNHALSEVKAKGDNKLYLCTDLTDYYEKNNWTYIGKGYLLDDEETRIYEYQI